MTIKQRFDLFTRQIRPTEGHIQEANRQTNFMIEGLHDAVEEHGGFTLEKVFRAGSNAKFTSLRRTADNEFDVDLGAYYSGQGATREELDGLLNFTARRIREIYGKTKSPSDVQVMKSAVRVRFRGGIKLNVDVAPIIRDPNLPLTNGGWIPRKDGWRLTSVTCHVEFVQSRSARTNEFPGPVHFNRLVRLVKWWNNRQGEAAKPSIVCDLLTAAAFDAVGITAEWQSSLRAVFNHMRQHALKRPVVFGDYYSPSSVKIPRDEVVLLDPTNANNNVTREWTDAARREFFGRVEDAYDHMNDARSREYDGDEDGAVDAWCEVFGPAFRTLSERED